MMQPLSSFHLDLRTPILDPSTPKPATQLHSILLTITHPHPITPSPTRSPSASPLSLPIPNVHLPNVEPTPRLTNHLTNYVKWLSTSTPGSASSSSANSLKWVGRCTSW